MITTLAQLADVLHPTLALLNGGERYPIEIKEQESHTSLLVGGFVEVCGSPSRDDFCIVPTGIGYWVINNQVDGKETYTADATTLVLRIVIQVAEMLESEAAARADDDEV